MNNYGKNEKEALNQLIKLLRDLGVTILMLTSNRYEFTHIVDRTIIVMNGQKAKTLYRGDTVTIKSVNMLRSSKPGFHIESHSDKVKNSSNRRPMHKKIKSHQFLFT